MDLFARTKSVWKTDVISKCLPLRKKRIEENVPSHGLCPVVPNHRYLLE